VNHNSVQSVARYRALRATLERARQWEESLKEAYTEQGETLADCRHIAVDWSFHVRDPKSGKLFGRNLPSELRDAIAKRITQIFPNVLKLALGDMEQEVQAAAAKAAAECRDFIDEIGKQEAPTSPSDVPNFLK